MDTSKEVGGKMNSVSREVGFTWYSKIAVENKRGWNREGQERESWNPNKTTSGHRQEF